MNVKYNGVKTVQDFNIVFNSLIKFEKSVLDSLGTNSNQLSNESEQRIAPSGIEDELEEQIKRIEDISQKRPYILSDVLLQSNPNDVEEWLKRIELCSREQSNNKQDILETYLDAIKNIDAQEALGSFSSIWISLANFHYQYAEPG